MDKIQDATTKQGTKRKRIAEDPPAAAKKAPMKKGGVDGYFIDRVEEMLDDPLGFDDCVVDMTSSLRGKAQRNQRQLQGFRKFQGVLKSPEMSGALQRPRGSTEAEAGEEEGEAAGTGPGVAGAITSRLVKASKLAKSVLKKSHQKKVVEEARKTPPGRRTSTGASTGGGEGEDGPGVLLGWVPGEPRWKKRSYFGPRSKLSW